MKQTTARSFEKELLNDIRVGCFHKEAVQALTALLCSENHTDSAVCCCQIPPHLLLAERCVYNSTSKHNLSHSGTKVGKWWVKWILNLLGRRSTGKVQPTSPCAVHPSLGLLQNSISHKRALAPHGPAGPEHTGQAGCDLPLLSRTRFTHPRGIFSMPGSAPTHCRSTWHVLSEQGLSGTWLGKVLARGMVYGSCHHRDLEQGSILAKTAQGSSPEGLRHFSSSQILPQVLVCTSAPEHSEVFSPTPPHLKQNQTLINQSINPSLVHPGQK